MSSLGESFAFLWSHLWLGVVAAALFAAGLVTSVAVVRREVQWLMVVPLWVVRRVMGIIGPRFPPLRVFLVIFCFNSVAIFLYMASGVLVIVPATIAFLTGINIGVIVQRADRVQLATGERPLAAAGDEEGADVGPLASLCGLAVLVIELPCFWMSVGMGIRLGRRLALDFSYTLANMGKLLGPRAAAYVSIVVPALFLSALAETVAIRGHINARPLPAADEGGPAPTDPDDRPAEPDGGGHPSDDSAEDGGDELAE